MGNPPSSSASTTEAGTFAKRPHRVSRLAIAAALLAATFALMGVFAGFGSRWGLWTFRTGFTLLGWAAYGGVAAALLSVIALYRVRPGATRRGLPLALVGLVLGVLLVLIPWQWRARARGVPPIHDITTDVDNPPAFVAVAPLRSDAPNPIEYGGPEIAAQQREGYPDIRPLLLDLQKEEAFQRALGAAREMGWEIVDANAADGRIEATDETFWFGFEDDVVIRLTPAEGRTILDVRSLSRIGGGDAGTNARRIREYLEKVRARRG